jgi:hypothetical protein
MSKSELIQRIADQHASGLTRKDIKGVIESLASIGTTIKTPTWYSAFTTHLLRLSRLIAAPEKWANHTEIPALFNEDSVISGVSAR